MDPELRELRKQQWEEKRKRESEGGSTPAASSYAPSTIQQHQTAMPSTLPPQSNSNVYAGQPSTMPPKKSSDPASSVSKSSNAPASASREATGEVGDVEKVHILPIEQYEPEAHGGASAFRYLAKELKRLRSNKAILREGRVLKVDDSGQLFVIVKIEPEAGRIG